MSKGSIGWGVIVALGAAFACLPFSRQIGWIGDEGILMRGAEVLRSGHFLYRDAFEIIPPTAFALTAAWLSAFGSSVAAMRGLSCGLLILISVLTFAVARRAGGGNVLAAAGAVLWALAAQVANNQVSHHLFTTAFSMTAFLATLNGRLGLAGAFSGFAGMTTQTRGALTVLAILPALARRRRAWLWFLGGLSIAPLAGLTYLLSTNSLSAFWADVVVWPTNNYSTVQALPFGGYATGSDRLFALLYPACLMLAVAAWKLRPELWRDPAFRDCLAFAVAGFVGSFPRPDMAHLVFTAPFAIPLATLCISRLNQGLARPHQWAMAVSATIALTPMFASFYIRATIAARAPVEMSPAGAGQFVEQGVAALANRVADLPADARVFFYPYLPLEAFLSGRNHVGTVDIFVPSYTTPAQYLSACQEVAARANWVVFDRRWTDPAWLRAVFPRSPDLTPPARMRLEAALLRSFEPVWTSGRFDLMRRRPGVRMLCA